MRWKTVRLIWMRELRDQLRDRRTLFMIAILPILLYPVAGVGLMQMALGFLQDETKIGIVGKDSLPPWSPRFRPSVEPTQWFLCTPTGPGSPLVLIERATAVSAVRLASRQEDPPLLWPDEDRFRFLYDYFDDPASSDGLVVLDYSLDEGMAALESRQIDLLLIVPEGFRDELAAGGRPTLTLEGREADDRSRLANTQVSVALLKWKQRLKEARLLRAGLAANYDDAYQLVDPERNKPVSQRAADELFKVLGQIFPFVLVMWSLAGALYSAVDLCAGEKERGTMETLLISPASREEIVWGKFLTIWVFSGATALLNLLSMGITTWWFGRMLAEQPFPLGMLFWGIVLLLPLSAFFSALALAVGVYARSTKEGQYYLMPLFLVTMPLVFLTLAPGVELNAFYSMVPVTGVALLLQTLMSGNNPATTLSLYFVPVLAPMVVYSWLALRWAIEQFQREEVLFREAEQLDVGLWLRGLWRDKEALPTPGQAFFCFGVVLLLSRLALSLGDVNMALSRFLIGYLAFVLAPPLLMAVLLTTNPLGGLALRMPSRGTLLLSIALAFLLFLPGTQLTYFIFQQVPGLKDALRDNLESQHQLEAISGQVPFRLLLLVVPSILLLSLVQAGCEELAFRGFIFTGIRRRYRPWTAVLLSSFLFALFRMDVFQFIPHFLLGVVMALLVQRSASLLPALAFRFLHNSLVYLGLLLCPLAWPGVFAFFVDPSGALTYSGLALGGVSLLLGLMVLALLLRRPEQSMKELETGSS